MRFRQSSHHIYFDNSTGQRNFWQREFAPFAKRVSGMDLQLNGLSEAISDEDLFFLQLDRQRTHAWLVSAPKSGSTWLSNLIRETTGWKSNFLVSGWGRREQEVDLRRLLQYPKGNLFSEQQHCKFSEYTGDFVNRCGVKVILLGRNIFDTVVSYTDHLLDEDLVVPAAYVPDRFLQWDLSRQFDFVIDLVVPWYFNFYCGWLEAERSKAASFLWVSYENLVTDPKEQLNRILAYLEVETSAVSADSALKNVATLRNRLNVGKMGRGQKVLSTEQQQRIIHLAGYYDRIDLTRIGLPPIQSDCLAVHCGSMDC